MQHLKTLFAPLAFYIIFSACSTHITKGTAKQHVLVFTKTNGYRHESIPDGIEAIKKLGRENNFTMDASEDSLIFTPQNLKKYDAIIFLNTTGTILGQEQKLAFINYMQKGGGFVGVHAATDCEYGWPWYVKMVGANFKSHPDQQTAILNTTKLPHAATSYLPASWQRKDEWYNFKNINPNIKVILTIDETSYKGGENGAFHPMAWYHEYENGKVFYTALGHTKESYQEPLFLQHLAAGILYSMKK